MTRGSRRVRRIRRWIRRRVRERIGTVRVVVGASAAWTCSLVAGVPALLVAGLVALTGTALVLRGARAGALVSLTGSILCVAGLAGLAAGAQAHRAGEAPRPATALVRLVAEGQPTESGRWRTIGTGEFGRATLITEDPPPAAGTTVRADLDWWGDDIAGLAGAEVVEEPARQWRIRARLREGLTTAAGVGDHAGADLLPGLVVGDVAHLDDELTQAMRTVSLSHVTAVSGSNIMIVAGVIVLVCARLRSPWWVRILPAAIVTAGYVFVVGPEPSVMRATAMAALLAVGLLRPVGTPALAVLATAITGLLIVRPHLASEVGFGLSVSATAALILLAQPLARLLADRGVPHVLAAALAVPTAAQLGVSPLLLVLDPRMSPYAVLANALAGPAVAPATVLGLGALAVEGLSHGLGDIAPLSLLARGLGAAGALAAWWIARVAVVCASLPGASLGWPAGTVGIIVAAGLVAGAACVLLGRRWVREAGLVTACACLAAGLGTPALTATGRGAWTLLVCDVGQGSAALVRSRDGPHDHALLVDTGDDPTALATCLAGSGITRLTIAVSHFDTDHVGALPQAVAGVDEAVLLYPQALAATADARAASVLAPVGEPAAAGRPLTQSLLPAGVTAEVLWPPPEPRSAEDGNAASLVLLVEADGLRILLPGDVGESEQLRLARDLAVRAPVDVLVAPHHGSSDLSASFYRAARARAGAVSVGADNTYGHPSSQALAAFGAIPVLRTDECGSIALTANLTLLGGADACVPGGR